MFPSVFSDFSSICFFLMMDVKLLQPCACVENFHGNWRIISCPIAQLSFFLCQMEILMNFSRICAQSSVLKVSFCRSEFGLPGLKVTDFGRNGQDLVLVFVNILRFLL